MTLCIAALCDIDEIDPFQGTRAVLSHDTYVYDGISGADDGQKSFYLSPSWVCLAAGQMGEAKEVAAHLRTTFQVKGSVADSDHAIEILRDGMRSHHRSLADRFVGVHCGPLTYAEFIASNPECWGAEKFTKLVREVAALQYSSPLLAVGWVGKRFRLFQYDKWLGDEGYRWEERDYYAAIGSGAVVAELIFRGRKHRWLKNLGQTIYAVYEAQLNASIVNPLVGNDGHIMMFRREGTALRQQEVSYNGGKFLAEQEKIFGLKQLTANSIPPFPDHFFDQHEWTVT